MQKFQAFRIHNDEQGYRSGLEELEIGQLMAGDVLVRGLFSSVNYKDALAATGQGKVVRHFPINGGIDSTGEVVESTDPRFHPGDLVIATGYGLGVSHDGGYSHYVRLPADWLTPLPEGMGPLFAITLGTAGLTAALALHRMEQNGQRPEQGPVLVTGASGGVGSIAVLLLAANGYEVIAATGKPEQGEWLRQLGARQVIDRHELPRSQKPLDKGRWAGIVDTAGGPLLAGLLPHLQNNGNAAVIGLTAGHELNISVMPLILRGVALLGIDSVECPAALRDDLWQRLHSQLPRALLEQVIYRVIGLSQLPEAFEEILAGRSRGRILVRVD